MTSEQMPERIWACGPSRYAGNWGDDPCFVEEQGATEYIRADLVEALGRQNPSTSQEVVGGEQAEEGQGLPPVKPGPGPKPDVGGPSESQPPATPRCKHCGHEKGEHKGEDAMTPGCLHVLPDDPGDGKTRYYCTCPGFEEEGP